MFEMFERNQVAGLIQASRASGVVEQHERQQATDFRRG